MYRVSLIETYSGNAFLLEINLLLANEIYISFYLFMYTFTSKLVALFLFVHVDT